MRESKTRGEARESDVERRRASGGLLRDAGEVEKGESRLCSPSPEATAGGWGRGEEMGRGEDGEGM